MKAAVITLNYNGKEDTLELLKSLSQLDTRDIEVLTLVVDNASSDGSAAAIRKKFPKAVFLQTGRNLGFAGGFNKGLDYAKVWGADYFLLINNDCLIRDRNLLKELIRTLEPDAERAMASPKIYFAAGYEFNKEQYAEKDLGRVVWFGGGKFDWDNIGSLHRGIDEVDIGKYNWVEEAEIFSGACVLLRREVLDRIGGFDEKYFLYFEDSDLAKRALNAGFKIFYNGTTSIYHKVSRSTGIGSKITDYYHTRNRLIFGMKYAKTRTKFALLREALKIFIFGRPAQRRGILDFYLGITGGVRKVYSKAEYPLKLSIGIVNYNTAELTKKLLESIFKKGSGYDHKSMEIIILDNGTTDPCKDKIKKYLSKIKYIESAENEGFSKGYNKTIKYSLGEYYLMLNSDIEILPKAISELVKAAEHFEGNAVLGGKLLFPDLTNQDSAFHLPTLKGAFEQYFLGKYGAYFMFEPQSGNPSKVEGLVMACFLIPRKVLNKAGMLDESKFIFFEDIEYCRRLKVMGIPVYFVPDAKFVHHHGASTKKIGVSKANKLLSQSAEKYHGRLYYFLLTWVLRLGQKFGRVTTPKSRWQTS